MSIYMITDSLLYNDAMSILYNNDNAMSILFNGLTTIPMIMQCLSYLTDSLLYQ